MGDPGKSSQKNTTPPIVYAEDELIEWARAQVKEPWVRICRIAERLSQGMILTPEQSEITIPLSPFRADYRQLYFLSRELLPVLISSPANLFTIILNPEGNRIIRACLQKTRYSNFVSLEDIELSGQWVGRAQDMLTTGKLEPLRKYLNDYFQEQNAEGINWVMIANIQLFGAFKEALDRFERTRSLRDYLENIYFALKKIYANEWINFSPTPKLFARLEDLFKKNMIEYHPFDPATGGVQDRPSDLPARTSELEKPEPETKGYKFVIALRGRDFTVALRLDPQDPYKLTVDKEISDHLARIPFRNLARVAARRTRATGAIALSFDPVINILYELITRPLPYKEADLIIILRKLLSLVRNFKSQWAIYPVPIALKNYVRLPIRLFRLPYDITNLADWFLPQVIVQGSGIAVGQFFRSALIILEGSSVQAVIVLEQYEGGIRKIKSFPASEISPFFQEVELNYSSIQEATIKAKHLIWEKDGWINFAIAIQRGLFRELGRLILSKKLSSLLRLPFAIPDLVRIWKILRNGGVVIYPDISLREANKWAKKRGRLWVYSTLIQIPFTRKRPRTRGLLYVKSTIIAAVILMALVGAIVWLIA